MNQRLWGVWKPIRALLLRIRAGIATIITLAVTFKIQAARIERTCQTLRMPQRARLPRPNYSSWSPLNPLLASKALMALARWTQNSLRSAKYTKPQKCHTKWMESKLGCLIKRPPKSLLVAQVMGRLQEISAPPGVASWISPHPRGSRATLMTRWCQLASQTFQRPRPPPRFLDQFLKSKGSS